MRLTKVCMAAAVLMSVLLPMNVQAAEESTKISQVAGKPADVQYPYIAQVVGNNVYVRSGNSQADYPCTKLDAPARVTVVDEVYGWAKILPPEGTYSWIFKAYVKVNPANPTVGILTGENVRVWAGADHLDSSSSIGLQTQLNTGEIVELYADQPETGDYYRIKPPTGAHLWINADFLKYVEPVKQAGPLVVPPRPDTEKEISIPAETQPSGQQQRPRFTNIDGAQEPAPVAETPIAIPVQSEEVTTEPAVETPEEKPLPKPATRESELLQQCYDLSAKIDKELEKPLNEQNYAEIKQQIETIKQDADAGKAAAYAQYLSDRIARYELAQSVTETLEKHDQQLEEARQKIEQAHQKQLSQIPEETKFLYTGTLKPSHVYTSRTGSKRYLLVDDNGKILCYMVAGSPSIEVLLQANENAAVGINGNIVSSERSLVTLVAVTEIRILN
jgi:hypothetical protein